MSDVSLRVLLPAFRLKTLPLALACICVGTAMGVVAQTAVWQPWVFVLTLVTAFSLQILSNIANDYGDGVKGTDTRQVAAQPSGTTPRVTVNVLTAAAPESLQGIRQLLWLWSGVTLCLGLGLLIYATKSWADFVIFLVLGVLSVVAAITYTVGRKAYGYYGLGDVSVFIFFGLVGVMGTYYLQAKQLSAVVLLPATAVGVLCVAVLNINNLRDFDTDAQSGKHTFAQCIGRSNAKRYHLLLIATGLLGFVLTSLWLGTAWWGFFWLIVVPFFARHGQRLWQATDSTALGNELSVCVKLTCMCSLLFSAGILIDTFG